MLPGSEWCNGILRQWWQAASIAFFVLPLPAGAELLVGIDEQAKLPFWEVKDAAMSLRLVQRLPDQTRAFFLARGFTREQTERIAQSCVFQTVFHNTSERNQPGPLQYDLREWSIEVGNRPRKLKTRESWGSEWPPDQVSDAARLALEWSLYPTQQTYQAGDYNWGMATFDLPPGTRFQLTLYWHQYGERHSFTIKDIQCAPDATLEPEESL